MTEVSDKQQVRDMSDAEFARRLRLTEQPTFIRMAELLGNDLKAAKAILAESEFIKAYPTTMRGSAFATKVRNYLVAEKLDWTQENLAKAVEAVQAPEAK
jgi:hypothetical protein